MDRKFGVCIHKSPPGDIRSRARRSIATGSATCSTTFNISTSWNRKIGLEFLEASDEALQASSPCDVYTLGV
jgi:hypothetical protein